MICFYNGEDLDILKTVGESFFMGRKIDIKPVIGDAAAHILYGVDDSADVKLCSKGKTFQIGRYRVVCLRDFTGIGVFVAAAAGITVTVGADSEDTEGFSGQCSLLFNRCFCIFVIRSSISRYTKGCEKRKT